MLNDQKLIPSKTELLRIEERKGSATVAVFKNLVNNEVFCADKPGVQLRITNLKQSGIDTSPENLALAELNRRERLAS